MPDFPEPDLCIIGAGAAGLSAAAAARGHGADVVLVERARMGGDDLHAGSVPSKALVAAARRAQLMREAVPFGITPGEPIVDFARVQAHVKGVVEAVATRESVESVEAMGVRVVRAEARFIDRRTLKAGDETIRARRFVIATGSRPFLPPIPGLDTVPVLAGDGIFELRELPRHLAVIGADPTGIEFAQAFRRLGAAVTMLAPGALLAGEDPELVEILQRRVAADGVDIRTGITITGISGEPGAIAIACRDANGADETLTVSHILVASGRRPNIEDLGLDIARVRTTETGIRVNAGLRTSNRRIYAIGDAIGGFNAAHAAAYQGGLVVRSALFGLPSRVEPHLIPRVTYTDPELARIGLTEDEAKARHGTRYRLARWSFGENDRARTERRPEGLVKLVTDRAGRVIGAGIVGDHAGEMISILAYMVANRLKADTLSAYVAPYPTLTETVRRLGAEHDRDRPGNPWRERLRRLVRLLP